MTQRKKITSSSVSVKVAAAPPSRRVEALEDFCQEELLSTAVKELVKKLDPKAFAPQVSQLYRELARSGLTFFKPPVFFGDDWFCVDENIRISIPFFLADERLSSLASKYLRKVEGSNYAWFMRLLRHESGHCFEHAFELSKTSEWQLLFGNPRQKYQPDHYSADPASKDFVVNLEDCYAQSHPEEDFAETFAVWLDPKSRWRERYRHKPRALAKLKYIERVAKSFRGVIFTSWGNSQLGRASRMGVTFRDYLKARRREEESFAVSLRGGQGKTRRHCDR